MRARLRHSRSRRQPQHHAQSRRWVGALSVLFLVLGLAAPLVPVAIAAPLAAAERKPGNPPAMPAPNRVNVAGSFQVVLGCPQDYDKTCQVTDLRDDDGDGIWSAFLPIPPGDYTYRVVVSSDIDRSLGEGGDPDATDLDLQVPADAVGVHVQFNRHDGSILAEPAPQQVTLTTDIGLAFAMVPTRGGDFEVYFDGPVGSYGFTVDIGGQPVSQDSIALDSPARVHVVVDAQGATSTKETVDGALVDFVKLAGGEPQLGACFAVLERTDELIGQACDGDDGQEDGATAVRVPNGLDTGRYVVSESFTPDGQTETPDQPVELGPGQFQIEATTDGDTDQPDDDETPTADETPTSDDPIDPADPTEPPSGTGEDPATGRVVVISLDAADSDTLLPGACFLLDFTLELCDDDVDGDVVFDAVIPGGHTLTETVAPSGYLGVADGQFEIGAEGGRLKVPHMSIDGGDPTTPDPTEPALPDPTTEPDVPSGVGGAIELLTADDNGVPVLGACFALTPGRDPNAQPVEVCDAAEGANADGAADGSLRFDVLTAGPYRLDETRTPDGQQPADGVRADATDGQTTQIIVTYEAATADIGTLVILVEDDQGDPVGETCFSLTGAAEYTDICDQGNDGRLNIPDIAAGEYTVTQTEAAEGIDLADPVQITVPGGGTEELTVANQRTEVAPDTGALRITATGADGQPLAGACYAVTLGDGSTVDVCDNGVDAAGGTRADANTAPGVVRLEDLPTGDVSVTETLAPAGAQPAAAPETATVVAGETAAVEFPAEIAPTEPETGAVLVVTADDEGGRVGGVEIQLDGATTVGPIRDGDAGDADVRDGRILVETVAAGDYTLTVTEAPDGFAAPEPRTITVDAVETARVDLTLVADAPDVAQLTVLATDEAGQAMTGACYTIANASGTFGPFCDQNANGDVVLTEVTPGEQIVTQTSVPTGGGPAVDAEQRITLAPGEAGTLTFASGPALGLVEIEATDPDGDPAAGGCYTLVGPETYAVCDGEAGDTANDGGLVRIESVAPGDYDVVEDEAPTGFQASDASGTITVEAGDTARAAFTNTSTPDTGAVAVAVVDLDGGEIEALPGACFGLTGAAEVAAVCDNEGGDADPAAGVVRLDGVPAGDYTLTQTRATDGFTAGADLPVTVVAGETSEVEVENAPTPPATGSLIAVVQTADGTPIGGSCVSLAGPETQVCDNGLESDVELGRIRFDGLTPGLYTLTVTTPSAGYIAGDPITVEVVADDAIDVPLLVSEAPPETGGVSLEVRDADGALVSGGCIALNSGGGDMGTFCDNGDEDVDPTAGLITLEDLPEGAYEAVQVEPAPPAGVLAAAEGRTFTVERGRTVVVVIIVILPPTTGDLVVTVRDDRARSLPGACFALLRADGATEGEICDDDGADGDGNAGRIRFDAVAIGVYTLRQTGAPAGYEPVADQEVAVEGGGLTRITIRNAPTPAATGGVAVLAVADNGDALTGACYAVLRGATTVAGPTCDEADGADGRVEFQGLATGTYTVRETRAPSPDVAAGSDRNVLVIAGQTVEIRVGHALRTGRVLIRKTDERGALLADACFALIPDNGDGYEVCDDDASDSIGTAGLILLEGVAAGAYEVEETVTPSGYDSGATQEIVVEPGRRVSLVFENVLLPPPPRIGNLTVRKTDGNGALLPGACFALLADAATVAGPRCDAGDGANDGFVTFTGVGTGGYALRETQRPGPGYEPIDDIDVIVEANDTVEVTVENTLRPGRVLIRKTDSDGDPLQGACFDLTPDGRGQRCTDAAGFATFEGVRPGTYRIDERRAPNGYLAIAPIEGVIVNAGATTVLDVINQLAPPPPDTGSIQVVKFYCPAGDGGEGTVFVDSSDAGSGRLARTAGCDLGNAGFRLIAGSGEGGPGDFATGDDGAYQTTLLAGDYTLTELDPDLPGESSEAVTVGVNQLTTVVVLNFVAPPAPAPAAVNIVKYTCDDGFQGRIFADFRDGCAYSSALTNNVTFRLSGVVAARGVTGDGGQGGRTGFAQLPAGAYQLREEVPFAAQTTYAFCGLDAANPSFSAVGATVGFNLAAGQTLTCTWFNVPDDLSETTGAIVVHKEVCDAPSYPAGFDYYAECDAQGAGVQFSLAVFDGTAFVPNSTGATDENGLLRFSRLQPGTYQLKEIAGTWCHAESDSVNARGDVLVRAAARANVYIFNCVPPRSAPNTGAGPNAWSGGSGGGLAAALGLVWPLMGAAGWHLRRRAA